MTREQLEALLCTSPWPPARARQRERADGIEDYLFIGGPARWSNSKAAARLGVSKRTIERWRKALAGAS